MQAPRGLQDQAIKGHPLGGSHKTELPRVKPEHQMCLEAPLWETLALNSAAEGEGEDGAHWLEQSKDSTC